VVSTTVAKFLYSAAMSLDGFIAGPGGDMSWMADYLGPNPVVDELIPQTGAILVGNRTFGGDDPHKGRPGEGEVFGGGWKGPQFVLTHQTPADPVPGVTFVRDIDAAITESRAAAGDKYVNILGSRPRSVSAQAYWTKSWCALPPCCSATASACSTTLAVRPFDSNRSASRTHLR
jgi:dihydrofolate reductase